MDLKDVFVSAMVAIVCVVAVFSWTNSLNGYYGTTIGNTFNSTLENTRSITGTELANLGNTVANNSLTESGASAEDTNTGLLKRSSRTFGVIGDLLGIIPSMIYDGANILKIPQEYQNIAVAIFTFVVGITLAYILLLGVKRLLS